MEWIAELWVPRPGHHRPWVRKHGSARFLLLFASLLPIGCGDGDTLRIAPPTGVAEEDRASVQTAFDSVSPSGTVQFEPGTYVLGEGVYLRVPDVTVLGHPEGTVLRGCDPEAFEVPESAMVELVFGCTGFFVQAERQTIRGLTFEYAWHGIVVGPYPTTVEEAMATQGMAPPSYEADGQRIEGNTFRSTPNGMRVLGTGDEVSLVRDNDFIDTFHAIGIYGPPLHFTGNRVRVEDPGRVPTSGHPASAVLVSPQHTDCSGHVVADNTVEGHPGAIYVLAPRGTRCRNVEIRDNLVRVAPVPLPDGWVTPRTEDDSTLVGVPITLARQPYALSEGDLPEGVVEEIVVQGNRIAGAEGIGILVDASRSRIVDNVITDIRRRDPFPGINWDPSLVTWEAGNGSGIWVGPGARENEIRGSEFEGIEGAAITLEGADNRVDRANPDDTVLDLGQDNRVPPATSERSSGGG